MPGPEGDDFDGDPVRPVEFEQIVGDADDQALLLRVVVGKLQNQVVVGKGLVGECVILGRHGAARLNRSQYR